VATPVKKKPDLSHPPDCNLCVYLLLPTCIFSVFTPSPGVRPGFVVATPCTYHSSHRSLFKTKRSLPRCRACHLRTTLIWSLLSGRSAWIVHCASDQIRLLWMQAASHGAQSREQGKGEARVSLNLESTVRSVHMRHRPIVLRSPVNGSESAIGTCNGT
jgi:hypothetical protein